MVDGTLGALIDLVTAVFVLATMLSMGLGLSVAEIVAPLRRRGLVVRSFLANLVLVPLLAFALVAVVPVETAHAVGILLVAVAPGAPFGPKLAELSRSDVAFASGLMAALGVASVLTIPLSAAVLLPEAASVDPATIAWTVVLAQLVPLVVGLGVRARFRRIATRLVSPIRRLSTYSMGLLIALVVPATAGEFLGLVGSGTLVVSVAVVAGSLLVGYALGGPGRGTREALATTTGARNIAIALLVATTSFSDPAVLTVTLAFGTVGLVVSVAIAGAWRRLEG